MHLDDVGAPTPVTAAGTGARLAARASVATTPSSYLRHRNQQWALDRLQAETAWGLHPAAGQTVAVIDTGVDGTHPDLAGMLLPGTDVLGEYQDGRTDPEGHGTHVAGIVDAVAGNGIGVASGPARRHPPGAGARRHRNWPELRHHHGILWAADHGATVISMSLGGDGDYPPMDSAVSYARSLGVVVVAAVGNAQQTGNPVEYPVCSPGVIGVAATDENDAGASETGPQVDIAAPGVDIASTYPVVDGSYVYMSGTSMATPYVSAAAALVRSAAPGLSPDQVATVLTATATDLGAAGRDDVTVLGW